jgi:hypothetical protein
MAGAGHRQALEIARQNGDVGRLEKTPRARRQAVASPTGQVTPVPPRPQ